MVSIKSLGFYIIIGYSVYNVGNILFFYLNFSTLYLTLSVGLLYPALKLSSKRITLEQHEIFAFLLIALVLLTILSQNIFLKDHIISETNVSTIENVTAVTIISIMWFFIGGTCAQAEFNENKFLALFISLSLLAAMISASGEELRVSYRTAEQEAGASVSHLVLERPIILLLVYSYAISGNFKYWILAIGTMALFFMGGRTALFLFATSGGLLAYRNNLISGFLGSLVLFGSISILFLIGVSTGYIDTDIRAVREILLLDGLEQDGSYAGRIARFEASLPLLWEQFWIGNYSLVTEQHKGWGGYIHNLLSAWQLYGFFVFSAIVMSLIYCLKRMSWFLRISNKPIDIFGALMLMYVILSSVLSKYVGWKMLSFMLGFWMLRNSQMKRRARKKKKIKRKRYGSNIPRGVTTEN